MNTNFTPERHHQGFKIHPSHQIEFFLALSVCANTRSQCKENTQSIIATEVPAHHCKAHRAEGAFVPHTCSVRACMRVCARACVCCVRCYLRMWLGGCCKCRRSSMHPLAFLRSTSLVWPRRNTRDASLCDVAAGLHDIQSHMCVSGVKLTSMLRLVCMSPVADAGISFS